MRGRWSRAAVDVDVDELREAPLGCEHRDGGLDVDAGVARAEGASGCGAGGRERTVGATVDEQAPDALEGEGADELLEVDAAVAQCAAVAVRLGDLRREGDDALQAVLITCCRQSRVLPLSVSSAPSVSRACPVNVDHVNIVSG